MNHKAEDNNIIRGVYSYIYIYICVYIYLYMYICINIKHPDHVKSDVVN